MLVVAMMVVVVMMVMMVVVGCTHFAVPLPGRARDMRATMPGAHATAMASAPFRIGTV
jgi:hypothetical protein